MTTLLDVVVYKEKEDIGSNFIVLYRGQSLDHASRTVTFL